MKRFLVIVIGVCLGTISLQALTSPYATVTTGPLNQSSTDDINGKLATTTSANDVSLLTDATSSTTPTGSVTLENSNETLTWDLGSEIDPATRRLDTVSIWIGDDGTTNGFNGSLYTSDDGVTFNQILDSITENGWDPTPGQFHNIVYNFSGTNISDFRYIQLSISPYFLPGGTYPSVPLIEVDVTTSVPEPATSTLLAAGAGLIGFSIYRKRRVA